MEAQLETRQKGTVSAAPPVGRTPPGPAGHFLLGSLPEMRRGFLRALLEWHHEYGDVVRFRMGPAQAFSLAHPDDVKRVLVDNHRGYVKGRFFDALREVVGNGVGFADGEQWLRQRRTLQPGFHKQRIARFADVIAAEARALLDRWRDGDELDLNAEMLRAGHAIAGQTMFSTDTGALSSDLGRAIERLAQGIADRMTSLVPLPLWTPTPALRRFRRALVTLDDRLGALITEHRRHPDQYNDLLTMLIEARDADTGEAMSDREIRDETVSLYVAAYETTSSTLAWAFAMLSKHPALAAELRAEARRVFGGRAPTFADLAELRYTTMFLEEVMRLYPPSFVIARQAAADDVVGGYRIPAGAIVFASVFVTHRHPSIWDNPEGFDPERFHPDRADARHSAAYYPFGVGPRRCIGHALAMMEMQLFVAMIAAEVRLDLLPGSPLEPQPMVLLRPPPLRARVVRHARADLPDR